MKSPNHSTLRKAFRLTSGLALLVGFSTSSFALPRLDPAPPPSSGEQPAMPDGPMPSRPAEDFKSHAPGAERKPDQATARVLADVAAASTESAHLSQLAARRADHADVRDFAGQVTSASQALLEEVDRIADSRNVAVRPGSAARRAEELDAQSGAAFDESYLRRTRRLHETAIAALQDYLGHDGADPLITALADQHLPGLHQHLRQAENLDERVSRNPAPRREDLIAAEKSPGSLSLRHPPVILAFQEEASE